MLLVTCVAGASKDVSEKPISAKQVLVQLACLHVCYVTVYNLCHFL